MQKMESRTDKTTGNIEYFLRGTDIGKDVTEQIPEGTYADPEATISVAGLKALVADAADYDAFVAAVEAL